jgi:hypothetical protein
MARHNKIRQMRNDLGTKDNFSAYEAGMGLSEVSDKGFEDQARTEMRCQWAIARMMSIIC